MELESSMDLRVMTEEMSLGLGEGVLSMEREGGDWAICELLRGGGGSGSAGTVSASSCLTSDYNSTSLGGVTVMMTQSSSLLLLASTTSFPTTIF